mgnify:CR=1 FL=1
MSQHPDTWRKPPFIANPLLRWAVYLGALAYFGWVAATMPIDWARVAQGIERAGRIFGGAFPPSFERGGLLIDGFLESLKIAILATVGGVALSIPIAFMAARNVAPLPVFYLGRAIIIIARSFHPVIVAIIFVKAVGFGPFAGVLTLVVYSIGFVAKMLAERIEEIDFGQVEAMRAAGAPYLSTLVYAIFPQIMPRQIGLTIYQLDSNLRASAVVGIVGAGGIGYELKNAMSWGQGQYDESAAIFLLLFGTIVTFDQVSSYFRDRLTHGRKQEMLA